MEDVYDDDIDSVCLAAVQQFETTQQQQQQRTTHHGVVASGGSSTSVAGLRHQQFQQHQPKQQQQQQTVSATSIRSFALANNKNTQQTAMVPSSPFNRGLPSASFVYPSSSTSKQYGTNSNNTSSSSTSGATTSTLHLPPIPPQNIQRIQSHHPQPLQLNQQAPPRSTTPVAAASTSSSNQTFQHRINNNNNHTNNKGSSSSSSRSNGNQFVADDIVDDWPEDNRSLVNPISAWAKSSNSNNSNTSAMDRWASPSNSATAAPNEGRRGGSSGKLQHARVVVMWVIDCYGYQASSGLQMDGFEEEEVGEEVVVADEVGDRVKEEVVIES